MRYVENLKPIEKKEMVQVCKPETRRGLDDDDDDEEFKLGSSEDLIDCQESSGRFPNGHMGKGTKMRSTEDLTDCHEDSEGILHCQLGDEKRSLWDLEDY
jgi:hypothetical protein